MYTYISAALDDVFAAAAGCGGVAVSGGWVARTPRLLPRRGEGQLTSRSVLCGWEWMLLAIGNLLVLP